MAQRRWVIGVIEQVYQRYGFLPLETPAIENLTGIVAAVYDDELPPETDLPDGVTVLGQPAIESNQAKRVMGTMQMLPEMREVVASYDVSRMIIVIILYIATALGILNTFFMSVMERTREFGVLMAVGMRPGQVRLMVLLETLAMGLIALVVGVSLGILLSLYMAYVGIDLSGSLTPITYAGGTILPRLHAVLEPANILIPALLLLLVCLLAGFLPANRAARMQPVVAIREE